MGQSSSRYNSITTQEKKLVLDTWLEIRSQTRDFGITLFLTLINEYPQFAHYWPFESGTNNSFEHFTTQFMREFDVFVMHINRPKKIKRLLYRNAYYHVPKQIPGNEYDRVRKCLVNTIGGHIGMRSNRHEILHAWRKAIGVCFSFIVEMVEDIGNAQPALKTATNLKRLSDVGDVEEGDTPQDPKKHKKIK